MADSALSRQSRHALLDGFDEEGVEFVSKATAMVIGAGGLGCPAATYLAASGIGNLILIDGDVVDITNLSRQVLFGPDDIGQSKVIAAIAALEKIAPATRFVAHKNYADEALLKKTLPGVDVVLDCTDRWASRQMINAACVRHRVPLVSASAVAWSGQILSWDPAVENQACYACVFDPQSEPEDAACGAYGVLSPLVGTMGCLQAGDALKILLRRAHPDRPLSVEQRLTLLDARSGLFQQVAISKNRHCPVCATLGK